MSEHQIVLAGDFLQSLTVLLSLTAYIPQWFSIYRSKSSENISLPAWLLWSVSSVFTVFYASTQYLVFGTSQALVFSSTMGLFFVIATVAMILKYRKQTLLAAAQSGEEAF